MVLPAYNAAKTLRATIEGVPPGFVDEFILVDDASQDDTEALSRELGLTTIRHPKAELGQLAVELLVSRVRNKELTVEALNVQPELVVRNSVAPPRPR